MVAAFAPTAALRAVIYCRVSTSGQAEGDEVANAAGLTVVSETSLDTQEAAGRAFADEQGWHVEAVFTDVYSGHSLFERPGLTDLREYVAANHVDRVIAYSLDRLSRKMGVVAFLNDELTEAGTELVFVTERYTNDSTGKLLQAFHEWKAESEREAIVERTMRGKRAKARAGRFQPGTRPRYGYRWPAEGRTRYEIDPEKALTVQQIFAWAAAGESTRAIAMKLTRGCVPTPTGRGVTWVHTVVRNILTDEMYTGRAYAFRHVGRTVRSRNGVRYRLMTERPEDQRIALPEGTVPALVDDTTFAIVGERLATNQTEAPRNNSNPEASLLRSGFLVCGYCGNNMTVMNRVGRYRCSSNSATVDRCAGSPSISVGIADSMAWERTRAVLLDRGLIEREVARRAADDGATERNLLRVDKLLTEIDRKRKNLTANLADLDPDSAVEVRAMLRGLSDRRQALTVERDEAQARHARRQEDLGRLRTIQQWQDRVAENLDELGYAGRRDALLAVGLRMTVWKKDHTPRWEIAVEIDPDAIADSSSSRSRTIGRRPRD
jgi:site-specific DNA recombinase